MVSRNEPDSTTNSSGQNSEQIKLNHETGNREEMEYLQLPAHPRRFLLSPPASPPVHWEQQSEQGPVQGGYRVSDILLQVTSERLQQLTVADSSPTTRTLINSVHVESCQSANSAGPRLILTDYDQQVHVQLNWDTLDQHSNLNLYECTSLTTTMPRTRLPPSSDSI